MQNIWRVRHFLAVAEFGSFQAAAKSLNISQPALSKSIRLLEEHLASVLFDRSSKGAALTSAGEAFFRRAREIESEWQNALIELNATREGASGRLRIGVGPTYAVAFLPKVLPQLTAAFPNLEFHVRMGVGSLLHPALQAGEISLYAGGLIDTNDGLGEGLKYVHLYDQENAIVSSRSNALAKRKSIEFAELEKCRWVRLSYDTEVTNQVERLFRLHGLQPPKFAVSTHSLSLALDLVKNEDFLTSLPRPLLRADLNPDLVPLNVQGYHWSTRSGITYRTAMATLKPVQEFIRLLTLHSEQVIKAQP